MNLREPTNGRVNFSREEEIDRISSKMG